MKMVGAISLLIIGGFLCFLSIGFFSLNKPTGGIISLTLGILALVKGIKIVRSKSKEEKAKGEVKARPDIVILFVIGILALVIIAGIFGTPAWRRTAGYVDEESGFRIMPPKGWEVKENPSPEVNVMFLEPKRKALINIEIGDLPEPSKEMKGLPELSKETMDYLLKRFVKDLSEKGAIEPISYRIRRVAGTEAFELVGRFSSEKIAEGKLKSIMFFNFKNKQQYIISYGAATKVYNRYLPTFEKSLKTFKILGRRGFPMHVRGIGISIFILAIIISAIFIARKAYKGLTKGEYINQKIGISILPPEGWKIYNFEREILFVPGGVKVSLANTDVIERLVIDSIELKREITEEEKGKFIRDFIIRAILPISSSNVLNQEEVKIADQKAYSLTYEGEAWAASFFRWRIKMKGMLVCVFKELRCYYFLYTAPIDKFDKYIEQFKEVIPTFKIL